MCLGFKQITKIFLCRRIKRQFSQIFRTDGRTFIFFVIFSFKNNLTTNKLKEIKKFLNKSFFVFFLPLLLTFGKSYQYSNFLENFIYI